MMRRKEDERGTSRLIIAYVGRMKSMIGKGVKIKH